MPTTLRLILGDQLTHNLASLRSAQPEQDVIMLCEVQGEASYVPHHPQKIALIFAAMRHFAQELCEKGYSVRYIKLDDLANTGNFTGEVKRALAETGCTRLLLTEPGEYRVAQMFAKWQESLPIPVEILEDDRFLCKRSAFAAWAKGRAQLRMEFFYREMRRKYSLLLDDAGNPEGGKWNYDSENRSAAPQDLTVPNRPHPAHSTITQEVLALVQQRFGQNFGSLENFAYGVTRAQALHDLEDFITHRLPSFGLYQDAMVTGEPFLFHAGISAYLNIGLLLPLEVCQRAEQAYRHGHVPLAAAEGFIRQILGWREYVRGIYWTFMPDYGTRNALSATRPLPALYWGGPTEMHCLREAVAHTRKHAYSHHIQRLMVTGNFALLAGLDVGEVQNWYLAVYADAFEWVEMPNTLGMALFGDGGLMASKPYAASGKYIHKMSNFCKSCRYNPAHSTEPDACPFNALYWDFLARNYETLQGNARLAYPYATLKRMSPAKLTALRRKAQDSLAKLAEGKL